MKRSIILIACMLFCTGCATFSVNYDFDPGADFTSFKTYVWSPLPEKAPMNELTMKRIKIAVNKQLKAKGLSMTTENPDMLIVFSGGKEKRVDVQEWGYGHEDRDYSGDVGYPRRFPAAPEGRDYFEFRRGVDTYEYEVGTLVLDFVDAKKKELVWRGTASGVIDPGKTAEQIDGIIAKLLDNYPPPKRK